MNCLIINNPYSGKCKSEQELAYIKERLLEKYSAVDIISTTRHKEAIEISADNAEKYHTYVVVGGDGTFSEVIQGIAGREIQPVVGYVPTGTTNDFAKCCNIPVDIKDAVDVILAGREAERSALFVNGEVAVYVVAAGMLTSSSYTAKQSVKRKVGRIAYYFEAFFRDKCRWGTYLRIITDKVHDARFNIVVCIHGLYLGGLHINSAYEQNADKFGLAMIKKGKGPIAFIRALWHTGKAIIKKMDKVKQNKYIVVEWVDKVKIEDLNNCTVWNKDGEKGPVGSIEIEIKPNQYRAIVGESSPKKIRPGIPKHFNRSPKKEKTKQ